MDKQQRLNIEFWTLVFGTWPPPPHAIRSQLVDVDPTYKPRHRRK